MSCRIFRLPFVALDRRQLVTAAVRGPSEEFRAHTALRCRLVLPGSAWGCGLMYAERRLPVACAAATFAVLGLVAATDVTVTQSYARTNNAVAPVAAAPPDVVSADVISTACRRQDASSQEDDLVSNGRVRGLRGRQLP